MIFICALLHLVEKQHSFNLLSCESKRPVYAHMNWHYVLVRRGASVGGVL